MTGYTVHTGASKKFVSGWDNVFGSGNSSSETKGKAKAEKKPSAKKGAENKSKKK